MEGQKGGVSATDIPWHAAWLLSCRTKIICGSCPLPLRSDHGAGCVLFLSGGYYSLAAFHCRKCLQEAYALPRSDI